MKSESRLTSNVLETFNDLSEDECEDKCLNHRLCKSINIKNSTGVNCELNSKSTEDPFDDIKSTESTGWRYKTTDYNARNVSDVEFPLLGFRWSSEPHTVKCALVGLAKSDMSYVRQICMVPIHSR